MRCNYSSTGTTLSLHVSSQGLRIILLLLLFNGRITTKRASVVVFFDFRHFWVYKKHEKKKRDCESGRASNHNNHNWTPVQSQIQAAKAGRQTGQPENSARALTEWVHHHVVVVCASRNHQRRSRGRQCWSGALKRKIQPSLRYDYIGDGITLARRSLDYGRGKWSKSKLVLFLYYFI